MTNTRQTSTKITATTKATVIKYSTIPELPITPIGVKVTNGVPNPADVLSSAGLTDDLPYNYFNPVFNPVIIPRATIGVIGQDDRKPITNTGIFPYSTIGELLFKDKDGYSFIATASLISKDTILTVGHAVYQHRDTNGNIKKNYFEQFRFYPGRKDSNLPSLSAVAIAVWTDQEYINKESREHDWAIIKLDKPIGDTTGWMGCHWTSAINAYDNIKGTLTGYPSDKPDGTMWTATGSILPGQNPNIVNHTIDMTKGESGGGIYRQGGNRIIAINKSYDSKNVHNTATRITKSLFNVISRVREMNPLPRSLSFKGY